MFEKGRKKGWEELQIYLCFYSSKVKNRCDRLLLLVSFNNAGAAAVSERKAVNFAMYKTMWNTLNWP